MPNITLTFDNPLPDNVQPGDVAWYLDVSDETEIEIGPIESIDGYTIIINANVGAKPPSDEDFVFYVKNPIAYVGQLKGYYADIKFYNNSTEFAELFSVGTEVFESSK